MNTKQSLLVVLTVLIRKNDFAVINDTYTTTSEDSFYNQPCHLQNGVEAFCINAYDCVDIFRILNISSLRARGCGSHNTSNKIPHICCEKHYILAGKSTTATPIKFSVESDEPQQIPNLPADNKAVTISEQSCGIQEVDGVVDTRILGGEPSAEKEFPWLARLLRQDSQKELVFSCTGALISKKVVLTTAHCLNSSQWRNIGDLYAVSLGENMINCKNEDQCLSKKKTVLISSYVIHQEYKEKARNHAHDIGLIFLRDNVRYTSYIAPICLLEDTAQCTEFYVAGWGKTENGAESEVKLKTSLPPFSWEQCENKYKTINIQLTNRQICAGGIEAKDSCRGDSGGPLMMRQNSKWFVVGVVSFGLSCGKQGWPAVYTYIPSYIDWIKKHTTNATVS